MPWSDDIAGSCLCALADNYGLVLHDDVIRKMLSLLGCNIPHYVQMFFGHVLDYCRINNTNEPSCEMIQDIYDHSMLSIRGHAELADLEERLRRVLGHDLATLALDLLTETAVKGHLGENAAKIIAAANAVLIKKDAGSMMKQVLRVLEHDGYIRLDAENQYKFVSRLIRDWWKRRFGFGYIQAEDRGRE